MALLEVKNVGSLGIIKDVPPYDLPPEAWSNGQNVRMKEGSVQKFLGHIEVFDPPSIVPYFLLPVQTSVIHFWLYAGLTKVFATDGINHQDITRLSGGDYSATANGNWTGVVLGGIPIINNGIDDPQSWNPVGLGQELVDLPNWPASTTCKALRAYKTFLIAMNVTKTGTEFPRLVKWSHEAGFNSVPTSWDETDPTLDAGEYELADTRGDLVDGLPLRDVFMLYKDDAIWGMQYIGPPLIFRFYRISEQTGILSRRCVQEFKGQHFVFGIDDIFTTDGEQLQTILDSKYRRAVFNNIDQDNFSRAFVTSNIVKSEMWACYPTNGSLFCNQALVWNWRENTLSIRDLPQVGHIDYGIVNDDAQDYLWNTQGVTWDAYVGTWNQKQYNPTVRRLLMAGVNDTKFYIGDETNQENGVDMVSRIERSGIWVDSMEQVKFCNRVYPYMEATGSVDCYVGSQMTPDEGIVWQGPFPFDPRTQRKIDCRVSGRLLAFKVESNSNIDWKINRYDMDIQPAGIY